MLHHLDSIGGTLFGTRAAVVAVDDRNTVLLDPHGATDMNKRFIFLPDSLNSAGRAYLRTTCTLGTAVTALERHLGLHEAQQVGRRTQDIIRTGTHAQLARRTMPVHIPRGDGTGRCDRRLAMRRFLIFQLRQSAVHFNLRLRHGCGTYRYRRTRQKRTPLRRNRPLCILYSVRATVCILSSVSEAVCQ